MIYFPKGDLRNLHSHLYLSAKPKIIETHKVFRVEYTRAHKYQAPYRVTDTQTRSPVTFPAGIFGFVTQTQDYNQDKTGISTVSPKLRRDVLSNAIRIRASLNYLHNILNVDIYCIL